MSENNNEKNVTVSPYMFQTRMEVRDYECDIQGMQECEFCRAPRERC